MSIPPDAFDLLLTELQRKPLSTQKRDGKSQVFGVVNKRKLPPDYSRQNWMRPYLYKLLLDFAVKYVTIPYTTITLSQNKKPTADNAFQTSFGDNYHITYHTLKGDLPELPPPSVIQKGNKFFFKRGDVLIRDGQPTPSKGRQGGITRQLTPVVVSFL